MFLQFCFFQQVAAGFGIPRDHSAPHLIPKPLGPPRPSAHRVGELQPFVEELEGFQSLLGHLQFSQQPAGQE